MTQREKKKQDSWVAELRSLTSHGENKKCMDCTKNVCHSLLYLNWFFFIAKTTV